MIETVKYHYFHILNDIRSLRRGSVAQNRLTWLHISDIHFHPNNEWRDSLSRSALLEHLSKIYSHDASLRPDFIFCTGDIAFGESCQTSLIEQYRQAREFFDKLLLVSGDAGTSLPKDRLFVVPGNHDVARSNINSDVQSTLNLWARTPNQHAEAINQRFNDRTKEFNETINRLDEYGKFIQDYLPHQHDPDGRHHYARITEVQGIKVGIAGFNSSWTCAGPEDDRNIWLAANWQFNAAHNSLKNANIRIGLIHHPVDWLNSADRDIAYHRLASDYDFWLHGHSHNAWVTPIQSHIVIAAGAIGANDSDEFGINLTSIDLNSLIGTAHLHTKRSGSNGWTIAPIEHHAPVGLWSFELPAALKDKLFSIQRLADKQDRPKVNWQEQLAHVDFIDRYLTQRFEGALQSYSSQPSVWISPILCKKSEIATDAKLEPRVSLSDFIANPQSTIIKAPPQYGLTCLAHYISKEAWKLPVRAFWLYLDVSAIKPNTSSINEAVLAELKLLNLAQQDINCVILDSWSSSEKDAYKLLTKLSDYFKEIPLICMERVDVGLFRPSDSPVLPRPLQLLYLWSLRREDIRTIVAAYNDVRHIGDEDAVTTRLVSDLDVLNLHRTPLNCLTLLKVSEVEFDESPVNRSEVIKRVLFLLFNVDSIPTYKSRPDLKDCEYVLGYFCELLIRDGANSFSRDKFLFETQKFCQESLIDLETQVVFDVLVANNILIKRGNFFSFKFAYWIFYFIAQRMHHETRFANYIFEGMRYAHHPEIIEFYTGIDRRRDDALHVLIRDIRACKEGVKKHGGLPDGFNPYEQARWNLSPEAEAEMQQVIADGVQESALPSAIKDEFADRSYDQTRPYNQSIANLLNEYSFTSMMRTMKSGARALRNSDYVSPDIKRELLEEIMGCWEEASKILLIVLPTLAAEGRAVYDGTGFYLASDFGNTPQERFVHILSVIPTNIVLWCQDDLFSRKMGPLLIDQLTNTKLGRMARHELILLLIKQRPRNWSKQVHSYIVANKNNSYYLYDIYEHLRHEYQYSFASPQGLKDIEHLIKMTAAKNITGAKEPGKETIKKVKFADDVLPPRLT